MDINRALKSVVKTGKVYVGEKQCRQALAANEVKLIVRSSNCPKDAADKIEGVAKEKNARVYVYDGTGVDLGRACGKPFIVSILTILDPGESKILSVN